MEKKEYKPPLLIELGNLRDFTKNGWGGENTDGVEPEVSNEVFGASPPS